MRTFICTLLCCAPLFSAYLIQDGRWIHVDEVATMSVDDHFHRAMEAYEHAQWEEARLQFRIVLVNFSRSSLAREATYFLGRVLYEQHENEDACDYLTAYLAQEDPTYREEALRCLLEIARRFFHGEKGHLFGISMLPKWSDEADRALTLCDTVVEALPYHTLAAEALLHKATHLQNQEQYDGALQVLRSVIQRFPSTEYAREACRGIARCHIDLIKREPQNTDILDRAMVHSRECATWFPDSAVAQEVAQTLAAIIDIHAYALYETAQLYARMGQPEAAELYAAAVCTRFPQAACAPQCHTLVQTLAGTP